jgi:hypothetical protein
MASIIWLTTPRPHYGPRCPLGFRFPGVYRITGFSFADDMATANRELPVTYYSLSGDDGPIKIAEPVFTPITHLDPALDDGWIIVKHHPSREIAMGYLEGQIDMVDTLMNTFASSMYQAPEGPFTLLHRKPRPTCEDHLLVFVANDPDYRPRGRPPGAPPGEYWFHITRANGELAPEGLYGSDENILWPQED